MMVNYSSDRKELFGLVCAKFERHTWYKSMLTAALDRVQRLATKQGGIRDGLLPDVPCFQSIVYDAVISWLCSTQKNKLIVK